MIAGKSSIKSLVGGGDRVGEREGEGIGRGEGRGGEEVWQEEGRGTATDGMCMDGGKGGGGLRKGGWRVEKKGGGWKGMRIFRFGMLNYTVFLS